MGATRWLRLLAGGAAANDQAFAIHQALFGQVLSAIRAVLHINHAPLPIQTFTVAAAIASTAAIVDIQDCEAAAGPILQTQIQVTLGRAGRAAGRSILFSTTIGR